MQEFLDSLVSHHVLDGGRLVVAHAGLPERFHGRASGRVRDPDLLDVDDVLGRRVVETAEHGRVSVREENAAAALEVVSRFAVDPRWLLHLPATTAPVATSAREGYLEHPDEAFAAYRADGVQEVVRQEKHMGSRAVALVCRDAAAARARFGAPGGATGAVWTRTGRSFFGPALTEQLVGELRTACERTGLFDELGTGWLLLDGELLPWNAKAEALLAAQGATFEERPHAWHLDVADRLVAADPARSAGTRRIDVDTTDEASTAAATTWWEELTAAGGEGVVVKPAANRVRGPRGLVPPGLKVRGREYLRLTYGPDHLRPEDLQRLRQRSLGRKRSAELREHALGLEGLARAARAEPLWRVHECVLAVLAMESEPVDPRL
ncbi:hypothetical protein MO973_32310 [Paenibacillus sp. TRM 82003]|nr:hypothetical protein [Kineococcus sp. TRM81007]MCI2239220.1 hypothetical protein [Kineococcus sp. TRM81007]MCI3924901.1 hypothetical protein [Paenibacillus sp. TRM 82003]